MIYWNAWAAGSHQVKGSGVFHAPPRAHFFASDTGWGRWCGLSRVTNSLYCQLHCGDRYAWHILEKAAGIDVGAPNSKDYPEWPGWDGSEP